MALSAVFSVMCIFLSPPIKTLHFLSLFCIFNLITYKFEWSPLVRPVFLSPPDILCFSWWQLYSQGPLLNLPLNTLSASSDPSHATPHSDLMVCIGPSIACEFYIFLDLLNWWHLKKNVLFGNCDLFFVYSSFSPDFRLVKVGANTIIAWRISK